MKKKTYINPKIQTVRTSKVALLSGSIVSSKGLGYGGVDEDGDIDPS